MDDSDSNKRQEENSEEVIDEQDTAMETAADLEMTNEMAQPDASLGATDALTENANDDPDTTPDQDAVHSLNPEASFVDMPEDSTAAGAEILPDTEQENANMDTQKVDGDVEISQVVDDIATFQYGNQSDVAKEAEMPPDDDNVSAGEEPLEPQGDDVLNEPDDKAAIDADTLQNQEHETIPEEEESPTNGTEGSLQQTETEAENADTTVTSSAEEIEQRTVIAAAASDSASTQYTETQYTETEYTATKADSTGQDISGTTLAQHLDMLAEESTEVPAPPPVQDTFSTTTPSTHDMSAHAISLNWCFGINKHIPVINLSDKTRDLIGYASSHTAILYHSNDNKQTLLQGHPNLITCTCSNEDKHWFATADKGDDHMIIVWDTYTGMPVRTFFEPFPGQGVIAMAMTADAKYLATLSGDHPQIFAIWEWTLERDTPLISVTLDSDCGLQHYIHFNPDDMSQVVSNGDHQVVFYAWRPTGTIEYFAPPLTDEDFNKPVGKYSQSIFIYHSTRALTATSLGNLIVWATNKPLTKVITDEPTPDKKALKIIKVQDKGIGVICRTQDYIVLGDALGHVKFFDKNIHLLHWYQDIHLGNVNSISFAYWPKFQYHVKHIDSDLTARLDGDDDDVFHVPDFVVGTTSVCFGQVCSEGTQVTEASFYLCVIDDVPRVLLRDHDTAVHAMTTHPNEDKIVIGSYSGLLKLWHYGEKETLASRNFDKGYMVECCAYDPQAAFIGVGFTNGMVKVVDAISLDDVMPNELNYAHDTVMHIAFSDNAFYLATADGEFTVTLYTWPCDADSYIYLGRHQSHYGPIRELMFGIELDSSKARLLSLSEDKHLVEYDLAESSKDNLVLLSSDRIEQSATPLCMAWYPQLSKESFILTANTQFKFKLYNCATKMCRKTVLGPTYGSPVQKVVIIPRSNEPSAGFYLAYINDDKVGFHIMPLDGNPHCAVAEIAHPNGICNLACSYDGKYLFTTGVRDSIVHMWKLNTTAIEAQRKLGGDDLIPFYGLLEGGREGEFFREMEDFFYYAQLRSQGVNTMSTRKVSTCIPVSEIPFVMRALGFYSSEQEVNDMLNEVKYSNYVNTGEYTTEIDLPTFIRLYVNHRPAFGIQPEMLEWAFQVVGRDSDTGPNISRGELLDLLQNRGEQMTEMELAEYLTTLLGFNPEGGSSELQPFEATHAGDIISKNMPRHMNAGLFASDLLGFDLDRLLVQSSSQSLVE